MSVPSLNMGEVSAEARRERDRQTRIALLRALCPTHPVFYGLEIPDGSGHQDSRARPQPLRRLIRTG